MTKLTKLTFAGLLILSAAETAFAGGNDHENLVGTEWRPVKIAGKEVTDLKPFFRFDEDGKIAGNGGCNVFGGTYTLKGRKVTFSDMFNTMMACPGEAMDNERAFLKALGDSKRMKRNGTKLVLFGKDDKKLATFIERH